MMMWLHRAEIGSEALNSLAGEGMQIDKKSPIPVYYQLKNIISKMIADGEYTEGSLIPSERELGDTLGISRMTVRQALNSLVNEGFLYREKGRGTFVARTKIEQKNIMSFSEIVAGRGMKPSAKLLYFEKEEPGDEIRGILELKEGHFVYNIKRLRLANNTPVGIEQAFIPEIHCPGLEKFDLTQSLYRLIREEYRHSISYVDNVIQAARPTKEEKDLLAISSRTPVLSDACVSFTGSGVKLLYERLVYRSDEYKFNIRVYGDR
jgi:GntR family transcriptional regulator